jgi:hypothetical protein
MFKKVTLLIVFLGIMPMGSVFCDAQDQEELIGLEDPRTEMAKLLRYFDREVYIKQSPDLWISWCFLASEFTK